MAVSVTSCDGRLDLGNGRSVPLLAPVAGRARQWHVKSRNGGRRLGVLPLVSRLRGVSMEGTVNPSADAFQGSNP